MKLNRSSDFYLFKKGSKDMFSLIFDLLIKWPLGILFALIF